ncbi:MAG: NAD(P)-dependent oxidoreductase [Halobacteriovoraceae bacterium]|nr:NAD(P)-dependent oxidoreductase [Halobacteriovoraceae bacterium]
MKILITGTNGFIGRNILKQLKNKYHFVCLHRNTSQVHSIHEGVEVVKYNGNYDDLLLQLDNIKIEGILHLASYFVKDHNKNELDVLLESNIAYGLKLLEFAKETNVKWFLNTSTFWTHFENHLYNPVNLYAATKQAFIDLAHFYCETSSLKFNSLELSDTFGPGDERNKIVNLLIDMSQSGRALKVSPGAQEIDISYIDDVVSGFDSMIELLSSNCTGNMDAFSLYSMNKMSLKELVEKFESVLGRQLNIEFGATDYRPREVMKTWNGGKEIPGFHPEFSFEKGIEQCLKDKGII